MDSSNLSSSMPQEGQLKLTEEAIITIKQVDESSAKRSVSNESRKSKDVTRKEQIASDQQGDDQCPQSDTAKDKKTEFKQDEVPNSNGKSIPTFHPCNNIGINDFNHQHYSRVCRNGIDINLIVVGESSLGKTTFVNSFLQSNDTNFRPKKTMDFVEHKATLSDGDQKFNLTIVDTPGFGDKSDNSNW